jgi:dihydroceramide fatty acyl 2-hydroxylase
MFKADWVETYFSRVRPWQVVAIWGPFAGWLFVRGLHSTTSPSSAVCWAATGVVLWTLLEYGLHRFVFHFVPNEHSEFQNDAAWLIHGIHHDYPWDGDRLVFPPAAAAVIVAILWWPLKISLGPAFHATFAGMIVGYVWYDLTHYYLHHGHPTTGLGRWLRRYHLVHHFATPDVRYGITTPLWDLVFGTYPRDGRVGAAEPAEAAP